MKTFLLCVINALLLAVGQILFKTGVKGKSFNSVSSIIHIIFSPIILISIILYVATTLLWLFILSKIPLSYAYPIQALAFPFILILSKVLLYENIPNLRWIGIIIIIIGTIFATQQ